MNSRFLGLARTVIVPLDYALNADRSNLSPASMQTLDAAHSYALKCDKSTTIIACGNTNHPASQMKMSDSVNLRMKLLSDLVGYTRLYTEATNSIDEAENIKKGIERLGVSVTKIHIFCDRYHTRRAILIWKSCFPNVDLVFHEVSCSWGKGQAQFVQKSSLVWFLANWVAFLLMRYRGIDSVRKIKQPS